MINRAELTDTEWQAIHSLLVLNGQVYVGLEENCRRFLNAVL